MRAVSQTGQYRLKFGMGDKFHGMRLQNFAKQLNLGYWRLFFKNRRMLNLNGWRLSMRGLAVTMPRGRFLRKTSKRLISQSKIGLYRPVLGSLRPSSGISTKKKF